MVDDIRKRRKQRVVEFDARPNKVFALEKAATTTRQIFVDDGNTSSSQEMKYEQHSTEKRRIYYAKCGLEISL